MIIGLDSAYAPNLSAAQAAKGAGIHLWSGYISTRPQDGIYHAWSQSDFDAVRIINPKPIAFASGWDDPLACKQLASQWGLRLCLDLENGIRGDGAWVQSWLNSAGSGLYGNSFVHHYSAVFHILSWYVVDPRASWSSGIARPNTPVGWQWWNSHNEFGVTVDRGYYDDWFAEVPKIENIAMKTL